MKKCESCLSEFSPFFSWQKYCSKKCRLRESSKAQYLRTKVNKRCYRCNGPRDGSQVNCSACRVIQAEQKKSPQGRASLAAWRKTPQGKAYIRWNRIKMKYGLSRDEYLALAESQFYKCAICQESRPLVVDHDHTSGLVRGLLCKPCNVGLGFFKDSIYLMGQAQRYLSHPPLGTTNKKEQTTNT